MSVSTYDIIQHVISKGSRGNIFGSKRPRGPNQTVDLIYECMIGVALELTNHLPEMFEYERKKYEKHQKMFREYGYKGRYTNTYGWDKKRENKIDFNFDPVFYHYFNRIIVPFLGGKKKGWSDENSKIWKRIKKLIISGDKTKIHRLQRAIRAQILKESEKKIKGGPIGANNQKSGESRIIQATHI